MANEDYTVNLYRLAPEVLIELRKAIKFYASFNPVQDDILLERADRDLSQPYQILTVGARETQTNVLPFVPEEKQSTTPSDSLFKINTANCLTAFDGYLDHCEQKIKGTAGEKSIATIHNAYRLNVLQSLLEG